MKCFYCGNDFDIITVNGGGGHNRLFCYDCVPRNLSQRDREKRIRLLILNKVNEDKISMGCGICGYKKCASALEWHHPNGSKDFNPSDMLRNRGINGYLEYKNETEKCILLCANCHRELHNGGIV